MLPEVRAFGGEAVEVWGLGLLIARSTEDIAGVIVGKDEEKVRAAGLPGSSERGGEAGDDRAARGTSHGAPLQIVTSVTSKPPEYNREQSEPRPITGKAHEPTLSPQ